MNSLQRVVKYCAIALAVILAIGIISAVANLVFGIVSFSSGRVVNRHHINARNVSSRDDWETVDFDETFTDVRSLNIDNSTGEVRIKIGDTFRVEAQNVLKGFEAKVQGDGELYVTDNESRFHFFGFNFNGINNPNSKITIYIPESFAAEEVKVNSGAGTVTIDQLNTDYLYVSAGAGNVKGSTIVADKVKIDGGVGSVNFTEVNFNDSDFDCGVGDLSISGVMLGDNKFDCGVGSVDLDLTGNVEDYDLDIDSGVGNVRVNGEKISDNELRNRSAANSIEVDGGVGDVRIDID